MQLYDTNPYRMVNVNKDRTVVTSPLYPIWPSFRSINCGAMGRLPLATDMMSGDKHTIPN